MADGEGPARPVSRRGPWGRYLLVVATTMLVCGALVHLLGGVGDLARVAATARWPYLPVAIGLSLLNAALAAVRLQIVYRALGAPVPFVDAAHAVLGASPAVVVLPSRASDFLRAVYLRDHLPLTVGLGAIVAEKAVDAHSLFLLALVGSAVAGRIEFTALAGLAVVGTWAAFLVAAAAPSVLTRLPLPTAVAEKAARFVSAFRHLIAAPALLARLAIVSLLAFVAVIGLFWVLTLFSRADVPPAIAAATWPFAVFVGLLPVTLAGMGTRDAALALLLSDAMKAPPEPATILLATFTYSLVTAWLYALLGLPFFGVGAGATGHVR